MQDSHDQRNCDRPASGSYFVWEPAGKSLSVHISLDLVDRLGREVLEGFKAVPRRGLEIGGFLLGRVEAREGAATVTIEDSEALPCEHRYGPSYLLSDADTARIGARLSAPAAGALAVVGFYRSQTRHPSVALDADDQRFLSRWFPESSNVFLIIQPAAGQGSAAGFFFWEGGELRTESSYQEFPFHSGQLLAGGFAVREGAASLAVPGPEPLPDAAPPHLDSRRVMEAFAKEMGPDPARRGGVG